VRRQTNVAGAAVLAGLIAGGAVYGAGHRVGDPALNASADARSTLMRVHPAAARHTHLLQWHPVQLPKHPRARVSSAAAPVAAPVAVAAAAPVAVTSAPATHTSPVGSGDDGNESEGGDD